MSEELDLEKYSKLFTTEAGELLQTLNDRMVDLERDPSNKELVEEMFRAFHSLKGMASMMNLTPLGDLAHALEDIMGAIRDGKLMPTGVIADGLFAGLDALDAMVASFKKSEPVNGNPALMESLGSILKELAETQKPKPVARPRSERVSEAAKSTVKPAGKRPKKGERTLINIKLARRCSLPSARAMVILRELSNVVAVFSSSPTEKEIENEAVFEEITIVTDRSRKLEPVLTRIAAMADVEELALASEGEPREKWRRLSSTSVEAAALDAPTVQTVKVGMDKLDDLLDNVGELVINRNRLLEKANLQDDFELREISSAIDKLASDIQGRVLGIRMIPLELVMGRFHRMVRDVAKSQDKEVELVIEGGSIELDRTIVDKIADPLMHLLRNSIDHGIETPEERKMAGKRPAGLIRIVASKQQDHVLIEVSDDGRGVDFNVTRRRAVEKGLMTKEQADEALGRELIELLFRPGFTTKTDVTDVSGRGVGLDVVKSNVESLGGSVMVNTAKGGGTTFSLWLPFTLAIIDAMIITIAGQTYAVPMGNIVESHTYGPDEIKTIRSREVVQLRGEVLPLIKMRGFFGLEEPSGRRTINTLIVQSRDRRAAIEVDDLLEHQEIVVKGLDLRLRKVRGISGGTILGRGNIALILDVDSILGA